MEPAVAFGKVLRQLRQDAGLTQEQLGFEADLRRTYISSLELGEKQPSLTTILKLAAALGSSAADLIGDIESEIAKAKRRKTGS